MKALCSGTLAELYLARHAGFENRIRLGDLMRLIRRADGTRIPAGTALQQRLGDRIRRGKETGQSTIRVWYENRRGAVREAWYWCAPKDAKRILAAHQAKVDAKYQRRLKAVAA